LIIIHKPDFYVGRITFPQSLKPESDFEKHIKSNALGFNSAAHPNPNKGLDVYYSQMNGEHEMMTVPLSINAEAKRCRLVDQNIRAPYNRYIRQETK